MHLTRLDLFFWVAGFTGNIILLAILWRRRRAHRFPFFAVLIAFYICRTVSLFFTIRYGSHDAYFYTYWTLAIVDVALQLLLLYKAASHIFCPTGRWTAGVRRSFLWIVTGSAMLAAGLTWLANPEAMTFRKSVVIRGNFFSSVLMSELFVGMIVLSVTTGLPWRTHIARIVQGWGVYAIAGILIEALQSYFGGARGADIYQVLSHMQNVTYFACLAYWIITLERDAPPPRALPDQLHLQLLHLNQRTAVALNYIRLGKRT